MPSTVHLDPWVVAFIAGTIIPLVTAVATKITATSALKAIVSSVLAAAVAVADAVVVAKGDIVTADTLALFATAFTAQAVAYFSFWKPVGGGAAPLARATENVGLG